MGTPLLSAGLVQLNETDGSSEQNKSKTYKSRTIATVDQITHAALSFFQVDKSFIKPKCNYCEQMRQNDQ